MAKIMKPTKQTNTKKESNYEKVARLLKSQFGINMDQTELKRAVDNMGLSDIVDLDVAFSNKDIGNINHILNKNIQLEYTMPNSGSTVSAASTAPAPKSYQPKSTIKPLSPSEVRTKKEIDQADENTGTKVTPEQEKQIADKEKELADLKTLAGIK